MMLPSVSVPMPTAARLAAIALPVPALEPHGLRSSAYGLRVWPPQPLQPELERVERKFAHSDRLVLPSTTAGLARAPGTHRPLGWCSARASEPAELAIGSVDVVLQQHRDAVQRAADLAGLALGVERVGVLQRVRIELDDRIELGVGPASSIAAIRSR